MADIQINVKSDIGDLEKDVAKLTSSLRDSKLELQQLDKSTDEYAKKKAEINSLTKSLNANKDALKDMKLEAKFTSDSFSELKEKMDGIRDESLTQVGSGVEKLTNSTFLLREGFENFDLDKIKVGFKGIGNAMKAIPALLIVTAIIKLIENFDKLRNSGGLLGKAFKAIGEIIDTVVGALEEFSDWIGITDLANEKFTENQIENAKKVQDAVTERYDIEIKLAQASGKSTEEIEKKKIKAVRDSILEQIRLKSKLAVLDGEITKEELAQLDELRKALTNNLVEEKLVTIKEQKTKEDNFKKHQDNLKQIQIDAQKELNRLRGEENANLLEFNQAQEKEKQEKLNKEIADQERRDEEQIQKAKDLAAKIKEIDDKLAADKMASDKAVEEAKNKGLQATQELTQAFFAWQLRAAEGDEAKQLEIRKRMFAVDKAFNVARAVQDGIRSVQAALTIPPPGGQILAGVNAALAAANVAKILATKFDVGGSSGGGGGSISSSVPNISTPTPSQQELPGQRGTVINQDSRVYVLEKDISRTQRNVARVKSQSKF